MNTVLTTAALFAALLLAACDASSIGFNGKCKEACATMKFSESESQADIDSAMKRQCEAMGRHGTPRIMDKSKTEIGFTCPRS
jgi:hypothetical protein